MLEILGKQQSLVSQRDFGLQLSGLVTPTGGLCGPTCAHNMFMAIEEEFRVRLPRFSKPEQEMTNLYWDHLMRFFKDIREGTIPPQMALYIDEVLNWRFGAVGSRVTLVGPYKGSLRSSIQAEDFGDSERISMIAFGFYDKTNNSRTNGHWVLARGYDPTRQELLIMDPERPTQMLKVQVRPVPHPTHPGDTSFELIFPANDETMSHPSLQSTRFVVDGAIRVDLPHVIAAKPRTSTLIDKERSPLTPLTTQLTVGRPASVTFEFQNPYGFQPVRSVEDGVLQGPFRSFNGLPYYYFQKADGTGFTVDTSNIVHVEALR
jgi:hypothetical protein